MIQITKHCFDGSCSHELLIVINDLYFEKTVVDHDGEPKYIEIEVMFDEH